METPHSHGAETHSAEGFVEIMNGDSAAGASDAAKVQILAALLALKKGDFSARLPIGWVGIDGKIADIFNDVMELNQSISEEFERVSRAVGKEGKISERAQVALSAGAWADSVASVNTLIADLVYPVRETARVIGAVGKGDLSKLMDLEVSGRPLSGEFLKTAQSVNKMVSQLSSFASEVIRVAREVGTEGKLGGQATASGLAGIWKELTDSVNLMAGNLTAQVRNIAAVTTAVANGDLSKKITVDVKGEILELKDTINTMVDQLNSFASEVTRVAREVGTEGRLGGQADVRGVAGTWKDLTDSVNSMAGNLTSQVRNIAAVTTAVANGDLSKKITVDVKGEILELKDTVNTMVDQLSSFASEVTRVAKEVGTEGKLGGQADVRGVAGTWKDLTDSVNSMAGNLTGQVRNIAEVTTAVANGDLSKKIGVDVKGEILELKNTINTMVDQLRSFASEVTRVAREVGSEGKLGGQAQVQGVSGTWKDLTDNVNSMARNLTGQVRNIAEVTTSIANGDLSKKITVDVAGEILEMKNTINTMVDQLNSFASEVTRVAREVGTEGKLGGQAVVKGVGGTWKDLTDNVNFMAGNLTGQVRNIADVTKAVASGDLSRKITVDVKGEILELKNTINTMVDQLNSFASEVTRVAREVGTEGKLGGQAVVKGVGGTWKDLTDNVNFMAGNLTSQVRGIAKVVTAVARGDLKQKLTVEAKGEIAELSDTINSMTDTLATFAEQVTTVAREVGVEGKLGGQASVPGASGTWRALTDNVNQLAANLTTQVRAIADVATAVTKGDLTRSIQVEARGEVAALKDNINEMIRNLKDTTLKNSEQDWLKTNLAKFSRMLQGQKDRLAVGKMILSELAPVVNAQQAVFYTLDTINLDSLHDEARLRLLAAYAHNEGRPSLYKMGEGLVGQCAVERKKILLTNVPKDYVKVSSGLGEAAPQNILVLPVLFEEQVKGVIELASFNRFSPTHEVFLEQLTESIGIVLNTIEANTLTEDLLTQSQSLAKELQSRQEELQNTNQELADKAKLLADRNVEVERKNLEVEQARKALEEKAEQLALTSKYKSEFLANMSHELRTPLNSLLILSDQLSRNQEGNLSNRQVEFSRTIHDSGNDLLALINDILDLSKIESGTVSVDIEELQLADLNDYIERNFRHIADSKGLEFGIRVSRNVPATMQTDIKRLQQVLKNLLSNAFKFTARGSVRIEIGVATEGWSSDNQILNGSRSVLYLSVVDTGIGIQPDKQQIIFEAFQQEDGSTSRRYGGTGLGLAISREISRLLGGEIRLTSVPNEGSSFTLYLPRTYPAAKLARKAGVEHEAKGESSDLPPTSAIPQPAAAVLPDEFADDRGNISPSDMSVLIVDNDVGFAKFLRDMVRENGFKALVTTHGSIAVALAQEYHPVAITLDIKLPDIDGWRVLNHLQYDLNTRHIPVHIISTEEYGDRSFKRGAVSAFTKPISKERLDAVFEEIRKEVTRMTKEVLFVGSEPALPERAGNAIGVEGIHVSWLETAKELSSKKLTADVIVFTENDDITPAIRLVEKARRAGTLSAHRIIVQREGALLKREETELKKISRVMPVSVVSGFEALMNALVTELHIPHAALPEPTRTMLEKLSSVRSALAGKKVLVVDDDIRNIFAMTSILERQNMQVLAAENGLEAIKILQDTPGIDAVLMDIMMPGMDGYETTKVIRTDLELRSLPIIALTAKAMKGDREKCLEAGASDYISKPVDTDKLICLLNAWLFPLREDVRAGVN